MKMKKDDMKVADFCEAMAAAKRDIESEKHRQYKLDSNKFNREMRDGMDLFLLSSKTKNLLTKDPL
eukprot:5344801-Ditylum_brightwellii.AAC.1